MNKLADIPAEAASPLAPSADLNREAFFNNMIGTLCGTIEDVVGVEDAEAFIGIVGRQIGNSDLARGEALCGASPAQLAGYLQQFKAQIGGEFVVEDVAEDSVTFTNCRCPFGAEAGGRPSLCMMTTNVFGRIAANATGYARVHVKESLAKGDNRCLVTVNLSRSEAEDGQEFFA